MTAEGFVSHIWQNLTQGQKETVDFFYFFYLKLKSQYFILSCSGGQS